MKLCKICGINAADETSKCYGCNSNYFIEIHDGDIHEVNDIFKISNEQFDNCTLQYNGTDHGWTMKNHNASVEFPGFGVIRPSNLFLEKSHVILDKLHTIKAEIERLINHVISPGHVIAIDHVEIHGDYKIEKYIIVFDTVNSEESKSRYPFAEMYAQFDDNDNIEIKISHA